MRLKAGVIPTNIRPELMLALVIADRVYDDNGQDLVITSLNDSRHSRTSLHYAGCAADLRTHYFTEHEKAKVFEQLKQALGGNPDYDVILESDHFHIEWQPKYRGG